MSTVHSIVGNNEAKYGGIIIIITSSDDIQPSTVITNQSPAD